MDYDELGDRLREELAVLALSPEPGASDIAVAVAAAKVDALLSWLTPSLDVLLGTVGEMDRTFMVSAELHGGIESDELDYHVIATLVVLLGRLVDAGLIQLPRPAT